MPNRSWLNGWGRLVLFGLLGWLPGCTRTNLAQPTPVVLRTAASFPVGAAMNPNLLNSNPTYRQTAAREYGRVTAENHLKMTLVHPDADRYDWTGADALLTFAGQNGQRIHGHTLVWHRQVPDWVTNFQGDSAAWEGLLRTHIQTVVGHYRGRLVSWDVVNEAFNDDGTLRQTLWLTHLGPDYIARAFGYAREADPGARLFYNDYGQEYAPKKLAAILAMAADFRRRGIPLDGLGLQMHININTSQAGIADALRQATGTGLLVHVSELDVALNPTRQTPFAPTDAQLQQQRQLFSYVVRTYRTTVPAAQQHGITTWNIGDADSWIPNYCACPDYPLPFDRTYQKKPAYDGFLDGLK